MPSSSGSPVHELKLFLAYYHGLDVRDVRVRGVVPGDDPDAYAALVSEAMQRAWRERGNRPLPPGYAEP